MTSRSVCSRCGTELLLDAVMPGAAGGFVAMGGDALTAMMERMMKQPRACPNCQKNFCTACAAKAAKENKKENVFYACPDCGMSLGSSATDAPTYIANPRPPSAPAVVPAAPAIPQPVGESLLASSRSKLNSTWTTNASVDIARQQLQTFFIQNAMNIVSERDLDGREIVVEQGSQFTTRMGGALFVNPKSLPKKAVIRLKAVGNGATLNVTIGETLGIGLFDPGTQSRYETYFREWIGELMRVISPAEGAIASQPAVQSQAQAVAAPPVSYVQQPASAPSVNIQRSVKSKGTALLLEILLGLIGLPGIGWIYGGRGKPGVILLVCFFVWNIIAGILVGVTGGVALLCTIPIGIATVATSSALLNKHIKQHPEVFGS